MSDKLDWMDAVEIAVEIFGLSEDTDCDIDKIEEKIYERYEMSFDKFHQLLGDLILLTPILESPLTRNKYHAFVNKNGDAICKVKLDE